MQVTRLGVRAHTSALRQMPTETTTLCSNIAKLTALTSLSMEAVGHADIRAAFDDMLSKLPQLRAFELQHAHKTAQQVLPHQGLLQCSSLSRLVLGHCIEHVPTQLYELINLESLEITDVLPLGNQYLELSSDVAKWRQLSRLVLRNARLDSLPAELVELGLTELDLSSKP